MSATSPYPDHHDGKRPRLRSSNVSDYSQADAAGPIADCPLEHIEDAIVSSVPSVSGGIRPSSAEEIPCWPDVDDDLDDKDTETRELLRSTRLHSEPTLLRVLSSVHSSTCHPLETVPPPGLVDEIERLSSDEAPPPPSPGKEKEPPVRWRDLPSYIFYQLRSFDSSLPDSTISSQVGLLQGCFTFAQAITGMFWGYAADQPSIGRKTVLMVGLIGTMISTLGFGFSRTFWQAMLWRSLGGALNGNVGVLKTMIGEIFTEKRYQSRAFLLQPMCFNIGVIVGPVLGGILANPVASYPGLFGPASLLGGRDGVWWLRYWPYALPNLVCATFLLGSALAVMFGLEETLECIRHKPDIGVRIAHSITNVFHGVFGFRQQKYNYTALRSSQDGNPDPEPALSRPVDTNATEYPCSSAPHAQRSQRTPVLSRSNSGPVPLFDLEEKVLEREMEVRAWPAILRSPILPALLSQAILATHLSSFNSLWSTHLSTPRTSTPPDLPFHFTGGLGFSPKTIGLILACLGGMGIVLQFTLYPRLTHNWGTLRTYRAALLCFPIAYMLAPYLSVIATYTTSSPNHHHRHHHQPKPSSTSPRALSAADPSPAHQAATGFFVYASVLVVLALQVLGRTFALPGLAILINNAVPSPKILGTVNGVSQSVNAAMRTVGPVLGGWGYGIGMKKGVIGGVWWGMAALAIMGGVESLVWLKDGARDDDDSIDDNDIVNESSKNDEATSISPRRVFAKKDECNEAGSGIASEKESVTTMAGSLKEKI